jgi:stearoyl-CoA desaturase (delta-9 desaturase)
MFKKYFQLFTVFYPVQIMAVTGAIYTAVNGFELSHLLFFLLGWVLICGLGSAVVLHRITSHRAITVRRFLRNPLLLLGALCAQGSPMWWAVIHRGLHHPYSDREGDPHSPIHGFWHAYHGWTLKVDPSKVNITAMKDLLRYEEGKFLHRNYTAIVWSVYILVGLISLDFLLWALIIPAAWSYHQESIVNTVCHSRKIGYRNYDTPDNSMNNKILALFTWGQALHNNHHHEPGSYDFGKSISNKPTEFDPCVIFLPLIRA